MVIMVKRLVLVVAVLQQHIVYTIGQVEALGHLQMLVQLGHQLG
jgi:hypothetical protein